MSKTNVSAFESNKQKLAELTVPLSYSPIVD